MDGILVVNKEKDMTSRDVINNLNRIFHTKKIGHTGTLDPIAEGVLVTCIGQATKLVELLTSSTKEYIAKIKLGIATDTLDITGKTIATSNTRITPSEVKKTLNSFLGQSYQEVPLYSAIKINGRKLYEYARHNETIKLPERLIEVYKIELLSFNNDEIEFKCLVSKGTYIRSLIRDICTKLNTCGTMSGLIRTKQGEFTLSQSFTLNEIENNNYKIISLKEALQNYEQVSLSQAEYLKVINGSIIPKNFKNKLAVFTYQDKVIAIYQEYSHDKKLAKPYRMFINN